MLTLRINEVHGLHLDEGVDDLARLYLFSQALERTNLIVLRLPVVTGVADGVVANQRGRHVTDEFLVFKLIERKAVASLHAVVVLLEVGYDAWCHHQLHIVG